MAVEEKSRRLKSKLLYKIELYSIKIIPILVSGIYLMNTILSYNNIDLPILSYIVFALLLVFLYLSSYAFDFCLYHRMFLHYITLNFGINVLDYYTGIPLSDWHLFNMYIIITGLFLFVILYLRFKKNE